jgi:hypothetical protein
LRTVICAPFAQCRIYARFAHLRTTSAPVAQRHLRTVNCVLPAHSLRSVICAPIAHRRLRTTCAPFAQRHLRTIYAPSFAHYLRTDFATTHFSTFAPPSVTVRIAKRVRHLSISAAHSERRAASALQDTTHRAQL